MKKRAAEAEAAAGAPTEPAAPAAAVIETNKKKKKRLADEPASCGERLNQFIAAHYRDGKMSEVELSERRFAGQHFFNDSLPPTESLGTFIASLLPGKNTGGPATTSEPPKGSPSVLIVCSGALRVLDVVKKIKAATPAKLSIVKLFARHMKVSEQEHFLKTTAVDVAVGTPNRIRKLVEMSAVNLASLSYIVIDMWRDVKTHTVLDMNDTAADLAALLVDEHCFALTLSSRAVPPNCKIAFIQ